MKVQQGLLMSDPANAPPASLQKKRRRSEGVDVPPFVVDSPDETKKKKKKKRREGDEDVEEISLPSPPEGEMNIMMEKRNEEERVAMVTPDHNVHMEEKKTKKKRNEEERIAMVTLDNNIHMEKKKKTNEEEQIAMVTPDNNVSIEKKKKKKERNEEEQIAMVTPDDNNVHIEEKKKKKKKKKRNEEEQITMVTPDNNIHIEKKKRKKVQNEEERTVVDEPPIVVSPVKTKKKKKRKEEQNEESIAMVTTDSNVSMQEKMMKKKRKRKREEDEGVEMTFSPDEMEKKKKKKEVKNEEDSMTMVTTSKNVSSQKKKQEEDCVVMETFESEKKKKKKKKNGLINQSVTMVTTDKTMESEPLVTMDNGNSRKKEKKRKKREEEEDCIVAETPEIDAKNITMITKKKNTESEHLEKKQVEQVTIETTKLERQKKKTNWNQKQIDGQIEKNSQNKRAGVPMETGDACSDAELQELQEFIPDVRKKSPTVISKLIFYDLPRFREFKKKGVALRRGRFSEEENQQIRDNLSDFLVLTGLDSIEELMFPQRFKNKEAEIKKLRKNHHYIQRIAEGIPRPCLQVLVRARKMMDVRNHMGRFTEDEVHALTKLHTLHGNDWKTIAEKMNRSTGAVLKRFATTGGGHGIWSPDEVSRLKSAVEDHLKIRLQKSPGSGLTRQQLCVNLPWTKISLAVESRTWYQCRLKWFSILKRRLEGQKSTLLSIQNKINIINTLFDMNVRESRDIDWMNVAKAVGAVTPVYTQKMFLRMKYSRIPNWKYFSYGEIVDILRKKELPRLLDKLKVCQTQGFRSREMQDSYQLSEIFTESGDLSGDDLSNDISME